MAATLGVPASEITQMRERNEMLGVWVHEHREYRFPTFQLHQGMPNVQMPRLLSLLRDASGSGWGWMEWLVSCRTRLSGERPADLIAAGRFDEVLALAQQEASEHPDARW